MIDDERNDIYIHVDKKVKNFDFDAFSKIPLKSNLFFTKRIPVYWGDYSMVECEYILFKAAAAKHYDYYHLLFGVDMPLASQDTIHNFFEKNHGKEFIAFDKCARKFSQKISGQLVDRIFNKVMYDID